MTDDSQKKALVITSIAAPTVNLRRLATESRQHGWDFIVIGDETSPPDFQIDGCRFYSLAEQYKLGFKLASLCPTRHYARKNLGYLVAMKDGADVIVDTDDDNTPNEIFWRERRQHQTARLATNAGWLNVYAYFSDEQIWPRGFPLEMIKIVPPPFASLPVQETDCPIQPALTNEDPDVDAVYRLTRNLPHTFRDNASVALSNGSWCPFNSQNTSWFQSAFMLMYLPSYCSFRMTDIWRSFVAQRIAWANEWGVLFEKPSNVQQRNEHNLLRDFRDEVPGYLNNAKICEALEELELEPGPAAIQTNLRMCYEKLCEMKIVDARELDLLEGWVADVTALIDLPATVSPGYSL